MKRIIILVVCFCLSVTAFTAKASDGIKSNHSVSTTLLGLEYSYEAVLGENWSLIGRIGAVPVGFTHSSVGLDVGADVGVGLSMETRRYFKNAGSFVSFRMRANTEDGLQVSFTPAYGIRRSFGKIWFHELTAGVKVGQTFDSPLFLGPHLQYRIGISF